ncbi:sugar ABC transporter substrate-binding protein [Natrinema sp. SYSU A 869]|uniref:ABC transporter substrate-binding protein n=1 Tax=Natrinema sp. SYSU A 869 TaxID=2871694 RepID=UPI001CA4152E|nr:sugar ABC transporter substrate-binding protein [Natrinema sp. SYSU A 869]
MASKRSGRNRRNFIKATGVGLLGGLAGCTRGGSDSEASLEDVDLPVDDYEEADIDWQQFEGSTIDIGAVQHPWVAAIEPAIPVFEELTGIDVRWNILPEQEFRTKRLTDISTGAGEWDVFFVDQVVNQFREAGWLQPLDSYFDDDSMYDEDWYAMDDLFEATRWQAHGGGYSDTWTGIPITVEVLTQFYRTDLYEEYGLEVAETLDEFVSNAQTIHENESDVVGTAGRGQKGYGMNIYILNSFIREHGGQLWDNYPTNSGLDAERAITAAEWYASLLQDYGPGGASSQTWSDVLSMMQSGNAGHIVSDANLFWPDLTDPEASDAADNIGIAKAPAPADGEFAPNSYAWQISTSKNADNSAEAFLFMLWASSEPTTTWMHLNNGAAFSVRQSVWENDEFRSRVGEDFAQVTLESLQATAPDPFDSQYPEWGQTYSEEIQTAIAGNQSVEEAMTNSATAAEDVAGE